MLIGGERREAGGTGDWGRGDSTENESWRALIGRISDTPSCNTEVGD